MVVTPTIKNKDKTLITTIILLFGLTLVKRFHTCMLLKNSNLGNIERTAKRRKNSSNEILLEDTQKMKEIRKMER